MKRVLERDAWRTLYRGEARQELPPIVEWKRFDPALPLEPGLFWCEDLREARRDLMAAGESPKVTLSSPSQYSGLRLRCGVRGARAAAALVRGVGPGVPGPAAGGPRTRSFSNY